MATKEIVEILLGCILAILGTTWIIKRNTQRTLQKQKSGNNSINIAIANNHNKEK